MGHREQNESDSFKDMDQRPGVPLSLSSRLLGRPPSKVISLRQPHIQAERTGHSHNGVVQRDTLLPPVPAGRYGKNTGRVQHTADLSLGAVQITNSKMQKTGPKNKVENSKISKSLPAVSKNMLPASPFLPQIARNNNNNASTCRAQAPYGKLLVATSVQKRKNLHESINGKPESTLKDETLTSCSESPSSSCSTKCSSPEISEDSIKNTKYKAGRSAHSKSSEDSCSNSLKTFNCESTSKRNLHNLPKPKTASRTQLPGVCLPKLPQPRRVFESKLTHEGFFSHMHGSFGHPALMGGSSNCLPTGTFNQAAAARQRLEARIREIKQEELRLHKSIGLSTQRIHEEREKRRREALRNKLERSNSALKKFTLNGHKSIKRVQFQTPYEVADRGTVSVIPRQAESNMKRGDKMKIEPFVTAITKPKLNLKGFSKQCKNMEEATYIKGASLPDPDFQSTVNEGRSSGETMATISSARSKQNSLPEKSYIEEAKFLALAKLKHMTFICKYHTNYENMTEQKRTTLTNVDEQEEPNNNNELL